MAIISSSNMGKTMKINPKKKKQRENLIIKICILVHAYFQKILTNEKWRYVFALIRSMEDYIEIIRRIRTCVSFIFCILYFLIKKKNHYINVKLNLRTRKGDSYLYVYERIEILYSRRRRTTTTQQNKEEDKIKSVYRVARKRNGFYLNFVLK